MAFFTLFQLYLVLATTVNVSAHHHNWNSGSVSASSFATSTSTSAPSATTTTQFAAPPLDSNQGGNDNGNGVTTSSSTAAFSSTSFSSALSTGTSNNNNNNDNGDGQSSLTTTSSATTTSQFSTQSTSSVQNNNNNNNDNNNNNNSGDFLDANNLQTASQSDGDANVEAGQSPSLTDPENFINFCTGQLLTNGTQATSGSCNGIPMGQIPSSKNMISTIITNPKPGDTIPSNQNFTVNIQVLNLEAGTFTNPNTTYYAAPQTLKNGNVVGHTHITIQTLGNNIDTTTPPDPSTFMFFKGVNDAGNGDGGLSATVNGGLPPGVYRVCTMTSAANHQPVLMPVAQRGAQDDCTKFTVQDSGNQNGQQNGQQNNVAVPQTAETTGGISYGGRVRRRGSRPYRV